MLQETQETRHDDENAKNGDRDKKEVDDDDGAEGGDSSLGLDPNPQLTLPPRIQDSSERRMKTVAALPSSATEHRKRKRAKPDDTVAGSPAESLLRSRADAPQPRTNNDYVEIESDSASDLETVPRHRRMYQTIDKSTEDNLERNSDPSSSDEGKNDGQDLTEAPRRPEHKTSGTDRSESVMSMVVDEEPLPKRRKPKRKSQELRSSSGSKSKKKTTGPSKGRRLGLDSNLEPDEAEMKRLQSWLLKCGIRKMWHRELSCYETPKAKINHLKDLLRDVGMTGRFSIDKATRIKEERELQAEVLALQASTTTTRRKHSEDEDEEEKEEGNGGEKGKRLAKGLRDLDFLGDDQGEETE